MHPRTNKVQESESKASIGRVYLQQVTPSRKPFPKAATLTRLSETHRLCGGCVRLRVEQMRHPHARGCTRPFPGLHRLGKRPWKLKASTAAGASTPPGSAVTAGRAMTAPAPAKRGAAAGARRALRVPPRPSVVSSSRLLLRASFPVCWLRGAAVRTSSR